ncbi:MAG: YlbF family regulator [Bacilli bacterium]|nr:YlbF family regulator [Bacilli bacterium]MDD4643918.1 YlbF family regulator [Bacilli bacterium]
MIDVMSDVDKVIDVIDKSDIIMRIKELKLLIDSDCEIQRLLDDYVSAKNKYKVDSNITKDLINAKKDFFNHPLVSEYRNLFSKLNLSVTRYNHNLISLLDIDMHSCGKI